MQQDNCKQILKEMNSTLVQSLELPLNLNRVNQVNIYLHTILCILLNQPSCTQNTSFNIIMVDIYIALSQFNAFHHQSFTLSFNKFSDSCWYSVFLIINLKNTNNTCIQHYSCCWYKVYYSDYYPSRLVSFYIHTLSQIPLWSIQSLQLQIFKRLE